MKHRTGLATLAVCAAATVVAAPADAQSQLEAYKAQCVAYGFTPDSPELAGCVQKLDMQQAQQRCELIAQQARFYCSGGGSQNIGPAYSAEQCGVYTDAFTAHCQQ